MKVRVLPDLCCGAQRCAIVAPEVYKLRDDGFNAWVDAGDVEIPDELKEQATRGARACPECAIKIVEE
jgi:ferredoxin